MDDVENIEVEADSATPSSGGDSAKPAVRASMSSSERLSGTETAQSIEEKYYGQMERAEQMRGIMAQMQEKYEELRVQMEFEERLLRTQEERPCSKEDAVLAIVGTPSMGWTNLRPERPYEDTRKPDFRGMRPKANQLWHRLACLVFMLLAGVSVCVADNMPMESLIPF